MNIRNLFILTAIAGITSAQAAWTFAVLQPSGASGSSGRDGEGTNQVGYATFGSYRAALWSGTAASYVNLHPAGAASSMAFGCSETKQVGYAMIGGQPHAGMWSGTAASFVDLTPAGSAPAQAYDVYGSVQVGHITVGGQQRACLWSGGPATAVNLHPTGSTESSAVGVSNADQVGYAKVGLFYQAARWTGTAASYQNMNPSGATSSGIGATSGSKQVGYATFNGDTHAIIWSGSAASAVDLHPAGAQLSTATAVLGTRQAGYIISGGHNRAVVWSGTAASMVDLHAVLPPNYDVSYAHGMWSDASGLHVVGTANNDTTGLEEAIIWTESSPGSFEFTLNKTQVAGQNSVQGTITAAATPNARVFTTYDNSSLVTTPPTVTLAANATVKNFQITVAAVTATINTTIYAKLGAVTRSRPLALVPLVPTALAFTPTQVTGGQSTSCRVVINGVAGPGGRVIAIFDNSPNATVPSTVTVPAGATQVIFNIATTPVSSQKTVTVTARVSAGEKTGTFRINP